MHSQPELVEIVSSHSAGVMVPLETLEAVLSTLLDGGQDAANLRQNGLDLIASMRGSSNRTLAALNRRADRTNK